jgi:hypothetical protein
MIQFLLLNPPNILQLLTLAFLQDCTTTWGAGTIEANTLCSADSLNFASDSVTDKFDTFTAAQMQSAIGNNGVSQSKGDDEMFYVEVIDQSASSSKDYQIPAYVIGESVYF